MTFEEVLNMLAIVGFVESCSLILIAAVYYFLKKTKWYLAQPRGELPEQFNSFLKANDCNMKTNDSSIFFTYLEKEFIAYVSNKTIVFRYICQQSVSTQYVNSLNNLLQDYNRHEHWFKVCAMYTPDKNGLNVVISYEALDMTAKNFAIILSKMSNLGERIENDLPNLKDDNNSVEYRLGYARELYLLNEQEIGLDHESLRLSQTQLFSIGDMVNKFFSRDDIISIQLLDIYVDGKHQQLTDPIEVVGFNTLDLLYNPQLNLQSQSVLFKISTDYNVYFFNFDLMTNGDYSVYFRLSAFRSTNPNYTKSQPVGIANLKNMDAVSTIVAIDKNSQRDRSNEVQYMLMNAYDLCSQGRTDELSDEQSFLILTKSQHYVFYYAAKYFYAKRYYEAIEFLENIFDTYRMGYLSIDESNKHIFSKVAYMLGFAYAELHNYKASIYYYSFTEYDQHLQYKKGMINAMINSADIRLIPYIDNELNYFDRFTDRNELNVAQAEYIKFLFERKAELLLERDDFDEVEKILDVLSEFSDSEKFVSEMKEQLNIQRSAYEQDDDLTGETDDEDENNEEEDLDNVD